MKGIKFFENVPAETSCLDVNKLLSQLSPKAKQISHLELATVMENCVLFIAIDANTTKNIGMATLTKIWKPTGFFGTLEDIVVDKNYWGRGIATKLIKLALKRAKELKMSHVELTSNPKRVRANKLYLSMGAKKRDTNAYRFEL
ncbi:MAG: GNAT family N-acetyltransferase [Parcubacteria group bacterium]|jgi:RimJ/RimL family protein N-acetyltransferase